MKTLVICTYFSFPDPETLAGTCSSTFRFLEACHDKYRVHFVARTSASPQSFKIGNISVELMAGSSRWFVPTRFHRKISSLKPDYVVVQGFGYAPYLILLRQILPNSIFLLQCNGFAPVPKGIRKRAYQFADRFIDGYLFTGKENARHWMTENILAEHKIFELMEGVAGFTYSRQDRPPMSFIWVGRLRPGKDPMTVLRAFSEFLKFRTHARLTIAGEGELREEIHGQIVDLGMEQAVRMIGAVSHSELEHLYNGHRYFVSGSRFEGSGFALAEAMSCGCVPLVTYIPPFKFMTRATGHLYEAGNPDALLREMRMLCDDQWANESERVLVQYNEALSAKAIADGLSRIFNHFGK